MHKDAKRISKEIFDDNMNVSLPDTCPDCGGHVLENSQELYCIKCGLVIDTPINFGIDWDDESDWIWSKSNNRAGKPSKYINGDKLHTNPTTIG